MTEVDPNNVRLSKKSTSLDIESACPIGSKDYGNDYGSQEFETIYIRKHSLTLLFCL